MRLLSLWFRMCCLSSKDVLKAWLHWVQLKGLSPEWINMCFLRSLTCLLEYSHSADKGPFTAVTQHVCLQGGSTHSWVTTLVTTVGLLCLNCKAFIFSPFDILAIWFNLKSSLSQDSLWMKFWQSRCFCLIKSPFLAGKLGGKVCKRWRILYKSL